MSVSRLPRASLRPFVELVWAADGADAAPAPGACELVLPTGGTHVVFRLLDRPLRLFRDGADAAGTVVGSAVIGGARAGPYLKDMSTPAPSVGALLAPGVAELTIGAPAGALAGAHTRLEDLWGARAVAEIAERLSEARSAHRRLEILEDALAARLPEVRGIDPLVAHALARFGLAASVGEVVVESGWSHRHFTRTFTAAVGLAPKTYCRMLRFNRALDRLAREPGTALADLAAAEGYADQPHFTREFRAFAGLSPGDYRRTAPVAPRHVPVQFVQDARSPSG